MEQGKPDYWFRKVLGTGSRYRATCWQGYAAVAAVPISLAVISLALLKVSPVAAMIALPFLLLGGLAALFAVVGKRAAPDE